MECSNCFAPIKGNQKSTTCSRCGQPLHERCSIKCKCSAPLCDVCFMSNEVCLKCEEEESVRIEVIRRSHLELYEKCPHAFELEVVKNLGHQSTIYTQSGIDLHDLFEEYSKHKNGSPDEMYDRFVKECVSNYPDEWYNETYTTREIMDERYKRNIKGFFALREKLGPPLITEEKLVFSVGENLPKVSITMDRIDEEDGEYVLGDYKTGKVMVGKSIATDLQAPLYILAVKQHYNKPVKRFDFYYLGEEKVRTFERLDDDRYVCRVNKREYIISLQETIREVRTRLDKIQKGLFTIKPTQKPYNCTQCQFYKTECDGCDTEMWNQVNTKRGY